MAAIPDTGRDEELADEEQRVADALAGIESAIRQRHAQLASLIGDREAARSHILELRSSESVQEPIPSSPRPKLGPVLVFVRKAVYHLFGKWITRPLVQQQNRFNQAARRMLVDQEESIQRLASEVQALQKRLRELSGEES